MAFSVLNDFIKVSFFYLAGLALKNINIIKKSCDYFEKILASDIDPSYKANIYHLNSQVIYEIYLLTLDEQYLTATINNLRMAVKLTSRNEPKLWHKIHKSLAVKLRFYGNSSENGKDLLLEAIKLNKKTFLAYNRTLTPKIWAETNERIAQCYSDLGDFKRSISYFKNAKSLLKIKQNGSFLATCNFGIATNLFNLAKNDNDIEKLIEVREHLKAVLSLPKNSLSNEGWIKNIILSAMTTASIFCLTFDEKDLISAKKIINNLSDDNKIHKTPKYHVGYYQVLATINMLEGYIKHTPEDIELGFENINSAIQICLNKKLDAGLIELKSTYSFLFIIRSMMDNGTLNDLSFALDQRNEISLQIHSGLQKEALNNLDDLLIQGTQKWSDLPEFKNKVLLEKNDEINKTSLGSFLKIPNYDDLLDKANQESQKKNIKSASFYYSQIITILENWLDEYKGKSSEATISYANLRIGQIYSKIAYLKSSEFHCDIAKRHFDEAIQYLDTTKYFSIIEEAKKDLVTILVYWTSLTRKNTYLENIENLYDELLSLMTWEATPFKLLETSINHQKFQWLKLYIEKELTTQNLDKLRDERQSIYKKGHLLITTFSGLTERKKVISLLQDFGSCLCSLHLSNKDYLCAFDAFNFNRSIKSDLALFEDTLPRTEANKVRKARLKWQKFVLKQEERNFENLSNFVDTRNSVYEPTSRDLSKVLYSEYLDSIKEYNWNEIQTVNLKDLAEAIPEDAVAVLINFSEDGCEIILVKPDTKEISHHDIIILPSKLKDALEVELFGVSGWLETYNKLRSSIENEQTSEEELQIQVHEWQSLIDKFCLELGNQIMQPVYESLIKNFSEINLPELMIVPTGFLSMFPLHAAFVHVDVPKDNQKRTLELFPVSYWPSVRSIISIYNRNKKVNFDEQFTAILNVENAEVTQWWKNIFSKETYQLSILDTKPKVENSLDALSKSSYSYFLCHGRWNPEKPNESGLVLDDGYLSPSRLSNIDLRKNRLTFLAACETGLIDINYNPNEFLGLPLEFIEAGLSCIISALWVVNIDIAEKVAERFFHHHLNMKLSPSRALQKTILEISGMHEGEYDASDLQDLTGSAFWAAFIVYGG